MSNTTTRRFVVLSQSVNTSDDVFNSLVEVQDKETGEIGTLLCSHMCNFPQELISQATWLEGCKTPEQYKDDSRLALGYHPEQYTQWRVFKELNEIEIYLTGSWNQGGEYINEENPDEDPWVVINLPYVNRSYTPYTSKRDWKESLLRLCDRIITPFPTQQTFNNFESLIHRLFNSGRISAWEATVLPTFMVRNRINYSNIHWEGPQDLFLGAGLTAFADEGVYTSESDFIPYSRNKITATDLVVTHNHEAGFQKAIDFLTFYNDEGFEEYWYADPESLVIVDEDEEATLD